ncbi:MAG: PAS domain-containing protein [Acidobacteria bacterium]|nr:PAS domain-containing protein [Acidobacteriota bacterium]
MAPVPDERFFEEILLHLQQTRGFEFAAYKPASLKRRLLKRMQVVGVSTFEGYLDLLQVRQEEFAELFNSILINVTSFFRDPEVWDHMAAVVIPELVQAADDGEIRIWSAGCASGQEPFTLAILLAEAIGAARLRERVKIYATDADDHALTVARLATYSPRQVSDIPDALLRKYFEPAGGDYALQRDLRRTVVFGRHDLLQDAPISRVDLLVCRNTLMYFNADTQGRTLARFYLSLKPGGYLLLGRAEMLFSHGAMFTPVDLKRRLFRPVAKPDHRARLLLLAQTGRVTFNEITEQRALQGELLQLKHELETAYEELETTNEELQSTVEELEATNEELQSTNEELETMNEELQSANQELQSTNEELRARSIDLNQANTFLESVFASVRSAVVIVNRDSRVLVWNDRAADLWGVRSQEAEGRNLLDLDAGLPLPQVREHLRELLDGTREAGDLMVSATSRRGTAVDCRLRMTPLRHPGNEIAGVILLVEEQVGAQQP